MLTALWKSRELANSVQTLQPKFKNVPTDASLVCSSTTLPLNRNESASVVEKVLSCNNPEVNQRSQVAGLKATIPVLSITGQPLMPCSAAKVRHLLQGGKAKVVKLNPFVIQLKFECENKVQEAVLGIDSGYKFIGFSAVTVIKEIFCGEVSLDDKTSKRLKEKRTCRRHRRYRLRYRKQRVKNRKIAKNWLPPSIQRRFDTHISLINKIKSLIPVSKVVIEIAQFDIQKIMNPDISGKGYQQGDL